MDFEWHSSKARQNLAKHGVSFAEAATVFDDRLAFTGPDPDHSIGESRLITFGMSTRGRLLAISHTEEGDIIRIINARKVSRSERMVYEEG